jgi:hypothetical protein
LIEIKVYIIYFSSSTQLQQLESRLRYSKTDKDTAEKKQRILVDKDLVDFQTKLSAYEVSFFELRSINNIYLDYR